jgi:hypothetical protein
MTDFNEWSKESLAKLAAELNEENTILRQQVRDLLDALRQEWIKDEHTGSKTRSRAMEQPSSLTRN